MSRASFLRLLQHLPLRIRNMFALFASLFTLRNVILLFCVLNFKTLPLAWEIRLFYRGYKSWINKRGVAKMLQAASNPTATGRPAASSHPLFAPLTIDLFTPLMEIDHNIHKSNSTYFTDLDESRTALVIRLLSSTKFSPVELESEGFRGPFSIVLGSVHTSFLKEIKPYERYSIRSRILGWDEKWILIGSVFVRPENSKDRKRARKELERKANMLGKDVAELEKEAAKTKKNEVLLATCLSKYVVKKGRYTVPPERCWRSAGWLPDRPGGLGAPTTVDSSSAPTPDNEGANGEVKVTEADLRKKIHETTSKAAEALKKNAKSVEVQEHIRKANEKCWAEASKWSWDDVEEERRRGLKIAEHWLGLDRELKAMWEAETQ